LITFLSVKGHGLSGGWVYGNHSHKKEQFFDYEMQATKGVKMPRGDKQHILDYKIPFPPFSEQQKIVSEIEKIEAKIAAAQKIIAGMPSLKNKVLKKYL
jgi:restriction endonuclease S subunit